jgi:hypothetical protein
VRAIPRATRRSAESAVTSRPSKWIVPVVGAKRPLTRLKKVVLPAPFGPMIARNSPGSIASDTSSIAARLPKRFEAPLTSRSLIP